MDNYEQRKAAIKYVSKNHGLRSDKGCLISSWELAYHLNNCWHADLFFSPREVTEKNIYIKKSNSNKDFALESWELNEYEEKLIKTIRLMEGCSIIRTYSDEEAMMYDIQTIHFLIKVEDEK